MPTHADDILTPPTPLDFQEPEVSRLAEVIGASPAASFQHLSVSLYQDLIGEGFSETLALRLLGEAFSYSITIDWNKAGFRADLGPSVRGDQSWPGAIKNAPEAVIRTWAYLHNKVPQPAVRARLADLLLNAGAKPVIDWAKEAIHDSGSALSDRVWTQADRYFLVVRALNISRQFRLVAQQDELLDSLVDELNLAIAEGSWRNRPFFKLCRAYKAVVEGLSVGHVQHDRWKNLYDVLWPLLSDVSVEDYAAADMIAVARSQDHRDVIRKRHVQFRLQQGSDAEADSFLQLHHYEAAAALAKRYDLGEQHKLAIRALQKVQVDSAKWAKVSSSINIPRGALERELMRLTSSDNWEKPLEKILTLPAPSGNYEFNLKTAKRMTSNSPIRHLVTNVTIGVHGLPERTRTTEEEAIRSDLRMTESLQAQAQAQLVVTALNRIKETFPDLTGMDVAAHVCDFFKADAALATSLGTALDDFWRGDYELSGLRLLFLIEGAARSLLIFLDEPLYRIQVGDGRGNFPSLDFYIDSLETLGFDPDWSRTIRIVLLSEGMNLRNLVAHGYAPSIGPMEAVLIFRIFGMFCISAPRPASTWSPVLNSSTRKRARERRKREAVLVSFRLLARKRRASRRNGRS